jgi:hypothetical protein
MSEEINADERAQAHAEFMKSNTRWTPRLMGIRRSVESIGETLAPDEDWMPTLIVEGTCPKEGPLPPGLPESARGSKTTFVIGILRFSNEAAKQRTAMMMRMTAVALDATAMAFVSAVWMSVANTRAKKLEGESDEDFERRMEQEAVDWQNEHGRPSQDPNRIEKLMIISASTDAEDDGNVTAFASIRRYKDKPPTLYDWAIMNDSVHGFVGRFPDAISDGLKAASIIREMKARGIDASNMPDTSPFENFMDPTYGEQWKEGE